MSLDPIGNLLVVAVCEDELMAYSIASMHFKL